MCFKKFSEYEMKQSSNWRELFAIPFALRSFAPKINNKSVHWETNNYLASLIVTSGSNKVHVKTLAENLYELIIPLFFKLRGYPDTKTNLQTP